MSRLARHLVIVALLTRGSACSPAGSIDESTPPTRTVIGSKRITFLSATTAVEVNVDLSEYVIYALIADRKERYGYRDIPGIGRADGTFRIPDVPVGPFLLYMREKDEPGRPRFTTYLATSADEVDMGFDAPFRSIENPQIQIPRSAQTALDVSISSLRPWQPADDLQFINPHAAVRSSLKDGSLTPVQGRPTAGSSMLQSFVIRLLNGDSRAPMPLIAETDGSMFFSHLVWDRDAANVPCAALDRIYSPAPFTVRDGTQVTLKGKFTEPDERVWSLSWQRSAFEKYRSQITTRRDRGGVQQLRLVNHFSDANRVPKQGDLGADLVECAPPFGNADLDLLVRARAPFLSQRLSTLQIRHEYQIPFSKSSALNEITVIAAISSAVPLPSGSEVPDGVPLLSPVRELSFDNGSYGGRLVDVDRPLPVNWKVPEVGIPNGYQIELAKIDVDDFDRKASLVPLAILTTTQNNILLPGSLFDSDTTYVFRITALSVHDVDLSRSPFRRAVPLASADVIADWVTF